ncbi:MAG: hypothetical protein JNL21_22350 [Myxococcales bacterium]|nr:hypothetical protein [Myxococcales bacterium]
MQHRRFASPFLLLNMLASSLVALAGCSTDQLGEVVDDVAQCIETTAVLGEGLPSDANRALLHGGSAGSAPRFLPVGVSETLVLEVDLASMIDLGTSGSIREASALHVCGTEDADFFDLEIATSDEEGDGFVILQSVDGTLDSVRVGVRRPASARLKSPPEAFWVGATHAVCAEVLSADDEPLYAERSMSLSAEGASLEETTGACALIVPSQEGPFSITVRVGDFEEVLTLTAEPYPG